MADDLELGQCLTFFAERWTDEQTDTAKTICPQSINGLVDCIIFRFEQVRVFCLWVKDLQHRVGFI